MASKRYAPCPKKGGSKSGPPLASTVKRMGGNLSVASAPKLVVILASASTAVAVIARGYPQGISRKKKLRDAMRPMTERLRAFFQRTGGAFIFPDEEGGGDSRSTTTGVKSQHHDKTGGTY